MKKNNKWLLVGSMCLLCLFLFYSLSDAKCPKALPPGYKLEVNQNGKYRPVHTENDRAVFWLKGEGTKCEATERAWDQYIFNRNEDANKWKEAK